MKRSKIIRASHKWDEFLETAARERVLNGVDKKFRSDVELSEMVMNCPSFKEVAKELTKYPRKDKKNVR